MDAEPQPASPGASTQAPTQPPAAPVPPAPATPVTSVPASAAGQTAVNRPDAQANALGSSQPPPGGASDNQSRYTPHPTLASILLASALVIIFGTGAWFLYKKSWAPPGYTGGGAVAAAGALIVLALLLNYPTLIMDDSPSEGGEPSTMRIMALAIVLTFCLIELRTAWNTGALPPLENQGNWVWLVTAALGGKALQKYAEIQENKKNGK